MMRVITLKQPWATLVVLGVKPVENRTWRITYRGQILIHAGIHLDDDAKATEAMHRGNVTSEDLPHGQIVGAVDLYDVVENVDEVIGDKWWFSGPVGWLIRDARQFDPGIPARGRQGIWFCPPSLMPKVELALQKTQPRKPQ